MTASVAKIDPSGSLVQATVRMRADQRNRLNLERQARGLPLADVLRDNLDLAFAVKEELSKVVEGEYDENDPKNAPRLVHTLLFRVEERILGALDGISDQLNNGFSSASQNGSDAVGNAEIAQAGRDESDSQKSSSVCGMVNGFISLIAPNAQHPPETWTGAFLEVVSRMELVGLQQLTELHAKGELWLDERGYYKKGSKAAKAEGKNMSITTRI